MPPWPPNAALIDTLGVSDLAQHLDAPGYTETAGGALFPFGFGLGF